MNNIPFGYQDPNTLPRPRMSGEFPSFNSLVPRPKFQKRPQIEHNRTKYIHRSKKTKREMQDSFKGGFNQGIPRVNRSTVLGHRPNYKKNLIGPVGPGRNSSSGGSNGPPFPNDALLTQLTSTPVLYPALNPDLNSSNVSIKLPAPTLKKKHSADTIKSLSREEGDKLYALWKEGNFGEFNNWLQVAKTEAHFEIKETEVVSDEIRRSINTPNGKCYYCNLTFGIQANPPISFSEYGFGKSKKEAKKFAIEKAVKKMIESGVICLGLRDKSFLSERRMKGLKQKQLKKNQLNLSQPETQNEGSLISQVQGIGKIGSNEVSKKEVSKKRVKKLCKTMQDYLESSKIAEACEIFYQIISEKEPEWSEVNYIWVYALLKQNLMLSKSVIDIILSKSSLPANINRPTSINEKQPLSLPLPPLEGNAVSQLNADLQSQKGGPVTQLQQPLLSQQGGAFPLGPQQTQVGQLPTQQQQMLTMATGLKNSNIGGNSQQSYDRISPAGEDPSMQGMQSQQGSTKPNLVPHSVKIIEKGNIPFYYGNDNKIGSQLLGQQNIGLSQSPLIFGVQNNNQPFNAVTTVPNYIGNQQINVFPNNSNNPNKTGFLPLATQPLGTLGQIYQQSGGAFTAQFSHLQQQSNNQQNQYLQGVKAFGTLPQIAQQQQLQPQSLISNTQGGQQLPSPTQVGQQQFIGPLPSVGQQFGPGLLPGNNQQNLAKPNNPATYTGVGASHEANTAKILSNEPQNENINISYKLINHMYESILFIKNLNFCLNVADLLYSSIKVGEKEFLNGNASAYYCNRKNLLFMDFKEHIHQLMTIQRNKTDENNVYFMGKITKLNKIYGTELLTFHIEKYHNTEFFSQNSQNQYVSEGDFLFLINCSNSNTSSLPLPDSMTLIANVKEVNEKKINLTVLPTPEESAWIDRPGFVWKATKLFNRSGQDELEDALLRFCTSVCSSSLLTQIILSTPKDNVSSLASTKFYQPRQLSSMKNNLNKFQNEALISAASQVLTLIQGPPGSGKTTTAVEIILEWLRINNQIVLACADSSIAISNLHGELIKARIKAVKICDEEDWDDKLSISLKKPHNSNNQRNINIKKRLSEVQVICSTCLGVASDYLKGFSFNRVIIDEATQITETSNLLPIIKGCQQLVLIGDEKQLPPTVRSQKAKSKGLGLSLFERLVRMGVKATPLLYQYRMHSSLAIFPNYKYYNKKIENGLSDEHFSPIIGYDWPNPLFRIAVIQLKGQEEPMGGSFFNNGEARAVSNTILQLISTGSISLSQIGVITSFEAQKIKLKLEVNKLIRANHQSLRISIPDVRSGAPDLIEVDNPEGFQGMERDLIIISTVRCNSKQAELSKLPLLVEGCLLRMIGGGGGGDTDTMLFDDSWREFVSWAKLNNLITNQTL